MHTQYLLTLYTHLVDPLRIDKSLIRYRDHQIFYVQQR